MSVKEKLTAIADAIRDKTKGTEPLNLDDMVSGVDEVYEAGKQKEWSDFWDAMQANGKRTDYYRAFDNGSGTASALGWNSVTFRPKYDLKPTNLAQGFMSLVIEDLDAHLKECGVILDTSNCTNLQQAFQGSYITVFPTLHLK